MNYHSNGFLRKNEYHLNIIITYEFTYLKCNRIYLVHNDLDFQVHNEHPYLCMASTSMLHVCMTSIEDYLHYRLNNFLNCNKYLVRNIGHLKQDHKEDTVNTRIRLEQIAAMFICSSIYFKRIIIFVRST